MPWSPSLQLDKTMTLSTTPLRSLLFLLSPIALAACGGSDGGGGTTGTSVSSGLPADAPVTGLSDADAQQLCQSAEDAFTRLVTPERLCTLFAVGDTLVISDDGSTELDGEACDAAVESCVAEGRETDSLGCDQATASDLGDCDATVGEVEACMNAQISVFNEIFNALSCSRTPTAEDVSSFDPDATPAECADLSETCPDVGFGVVVSAEGSQEPPSPTGCDDTCVTANDGECDDGGQGAVTSICGFGTDCADCGERQLATSG
jgi:hypothetical protein